MRTIRTFFNRRLELSALIVFIALAMKALVPAGYMVMPDANGAISIGTCHGMSTGQASISSAQHHGATDSMANAMQHHGESDTGHHSGNNSDGGACAYTALVHAALDNTMSPLLLAAAFVFLVSLYLFLTPNSKRLALRYALPPSHAPPVSI